MAKKPPPIMIEMRHLKKAWGYAVIGERKIILDPRMPPEKLMEISIHEVGHILFPFMAEEPILELGKTSADVLLRLGFWQKPQRDD